MLILARANSWRGCPCLELPAGRLEGHLLLACVEELDPVKGPLLSCRLTWHTPALTCQPGWSLWQLLTVTPTSASPEDWLVTARAQAQLWSPGQRETQPRWDPSGHWLGFLMGKGWRWDIA